MNKHAKVYTSLSLAAAAVLAVAASSALGQALLMGDQVKQSVNKVNSELKWNTSLEQCKWQAKKEGKLVFWLHMLGSLNGYT
jgi:hypothetical protein